MDPLDRTAQAVEHARFALGIALGNLTMAHTMGHDTAAATTAYTDALAALETAVRADERAHWQGVITDSAPRRRATDSLGAFEVVPPSATGEIAKTTAHWRVQCTKRNVCDAPCGGCYASRSETNLAGFDVTDIRESRRFHIEDPDGAC